MIHEKKRWYTNTEMEQFNVKTNNRGQCWTCKHREGLVYADDEDDPDIKWKIPVCDQCGGTIMVKVYDEKCRAYEKE